MTTLSEAQIGLLKQTAADTCGVVAPPQAKLTAASLIRRGLVISQPQVEGPTRLTITQAGRAALAAPVTETSTGEQPVPAALISNTDDRVEHPPVAPTASKPATTIDKLLGLLRRDAGATIQDMMAATGWQAHSVRGALSGSIKKSLSLDVRSDVTPVSHPAVTRVRR